MNGLIKATGLSAIVLKPVALPDKKHLPGPGYFLLPLLARNISKKITAPTMSIPVHIPALKMPPITSQPDNVVNKKSSAKESVRFIIKI